MPQLGIDYETTDGKTYKRLCPKCEGLIYYNKVQAVNRACRDRDLCLECGYIERSVKQEKPLPAGTWTEGSLFFRTCPCCKKDVSYNSKKCLVKAVKFNRLCVPCSQTPDQLAKKLEKSTSYKHKPKEVILSNGDKVKVQGYEHLAIDFLQGEGIAPENIAVKYSDKPKVPYTFEGKPHTYLPDLFLKDSNCIIEVKSDFTYRIQEQVNVAKREACLNLGYSYRLLLYKRNGRELVDTTFSPSCN